MSTSEMNFKDFDLKPQLLQAVAEMGYEKPTDIQIQAIPILLEKSTDFVGQAQTGTGKTAAFCLPLINQLDLTKKHIQAIILTPTRELAGQVHDEILKFAKHLPVKTQLICGGNSYVKQIGGLRDKMPQIVVGTPGRIIDLINSKKLKLHDTKQIILDEADEMLKMGFLEDVKKILGSLEGSKKTWMFSATLPRPIIDLINTELSNPVMLKVRTATLSNADIEQQYHVVKSRYKKEALCRILDAEEDFYGVIFCITKRETAELGEYLTHRGYKIELLHGDMAQAQRDTAMRLFKSGASRVLLCTDVAARGIDVNNLSHVVNYGLPRELASYVHRIGRTGRAGAKGIAVSVITPDEVHKIRKLENLTKSKINYCRLASGEILKNVRVQNKIKNITPQIQVIQEKGQEYKVDDTYKSFQREFEPLSKEEALKVVFNSLFKKELRQIDDIGEIEELDLKKFSKVYGDGKSKKGSFRRQRDRGRSRGTRSRSNNRSRHA